MERSICDLIRSRSGIEMTCDELERYSSNFSGWVDVCKPKEG